MTTDACATPGCGHAQVSHSAAGVCGNDHFGESERCSCRAYLPPRPVPEEGPEGPETSYNVCKCGHREGWHHTPYRPNCTGSFGECPCFVFEFDHAWPPATVPAPHAEASELATLRVRDEHYEILLQDNLRLSAELAAANTAHSAEVERLMDLADERVDENAELIVEAESLRHENAALSARLEELEGKQ